MPRLSWEEEVRKIGFFLDQLLYKQEPREDIGMGFFQTQFSLLSHKARMWQVGT